jgi:hypothetical protein
MGSTLASLLIPAAPGGLACAKKTRGARRAPMLYCAKRAFVNHAGGCAARAVQR